MDPSEYTRMAEAEQHSWWFRGRRRVLDSVLGRLELPPGARICDLGCGTGGNLPMLQAHGEVVGVERDESAARMARESTGLDVRQGSAEATGLPAHSFDLVCMFDVLEHLPAEGPALAEVRRILRPGGRLLLTVPAFMMLWSGHDVALHHHRRYRRAGLARELLNAGLDLQWLSYYNIALFPPVAVVRVGRRVLGGGSARADLGAGAQGLTARVLEAVFAAERHVVGRLPLPLGVSLIGVARAP
ncbi:MAG: class I SAM-dependent methyltransferase [Deltaproteobacteria bacterium]|nr:class I SAM-dependent methyltransferase [Deltaproteobacteria bacterium]MCB9788675.1 class I SAM-dependent methyltransferase [Deltaproteobacteria bacterium]